MSCEPKCHAYGIGCPCRDLATTPAEEVAEVAVEERGLREVLDRYFDFDVDPWEDHEAACPAPEDIWRLHRDLKAALEAQ